MQTVAVTGASGYLGSYVVKLLLESGNYIVRGTVRDPTNPDKTKHLLSLPGASERLTLHAADLTDPSPEKFINIFTGCDGVFHTASPFFIDAKAGTKETLVDPAVNGTSLILQSVLATQETVKKLIVTSSTAAVYANFGTLGPSHVYTEDDWSVSSLLESNESWYALGKTLAEKLVYDFVLENKVAFEVCTLNPTWILGPMLQPGLNQSCKKVADYVTGATAEIPRASKTIVDVRDVALAHVRAFEVKEARGRFLLLAESVWEEDFAAHVQDALDQTSGLSQYHVTTNKDKGSTAAPVVFGAAQPSHILFECSKARDVLGIKSFRTSSEMILETLKSLQQHSLI